MTAEGVKVKTESESAQAGAKRFHCFEKKPAAIKPRALECESAIYALRCSTHRAAVVPPQAEGDWLRGAASDGLIGVASLFACCVGGVPLTRAMNPWAMPAAST